jgi:protein-disulfide isomerase
MTAIRLAACAVVLVLSFACSPPAPQSSGPAATTKDADVVAGRISGKDVTVGEVDAWIMDKLFRNATGDLDASRLFDIRKRALEQMASERALDDKATAEKTTREALLEAEVAKRATVSDDEVNAFWEQHKQRYGKRTFEQVQPSIRRQLEAQKRQNATAAYVTELRSGLGFESLLQAPRFEISGSGPSLGPDQAPVTVVEFSDYQCPFCKNIEPVIEQVIARYPTQVRFVHRHYPLDSIHPQARGAALAAACAQDQGKFWEFHRALFANAPKLGDAELKSYAAQVDLDQAAFAACLDQKKHEELIAADVAAGDAAGVSGTPSFFVNGLVVAGARNVDQFAEVIDAELERLGVPVPPKPPAPTPTAQAPAAPPAPDAAPAAAAPAAAPAPAPAAAPAQAAPPAAPSGSPATP